MRKHETFHVRAVAYQAFLGFVFGFVLLHPVSMVIFHWLDPRLAHGMPGTSGSGALVAVLHSFEPSMFPMGVVYGVLAGVIAAVNGHQRSIIQGQRDALKKQNRQLEKLARMNRRNTRFIVHDLKTHVGCILGFSTLLLEEQDAHSPTESVDALRRIQRQATVLRDNINEILQFAQLQETGKIHREEVSVSKLLDFTVDALSPLEKGQQVVIAPEAKDCPAVWGDPSLLRRVLANLASNSLKHNAANLHVLLSAVPLPGGAEVMFSCIDNGDGIPAEMRDSIFEEFRSGAQGKQESSGLGLAFCRAAVEAHGGKIWFDNGHEGGSRFNFTVPTRKENVQDE